MKNSYEVRAQKFIAALFPYIADGFYYKYEELRNCIQNGVEQFILEHPNRKIHFSSGISRIAIITSDYVIKIDYDKDSGFGTCEDEVEAYDYICECGYQKYFAKITSYIYCGKVFYIMPRINNINYCDYDVDRYCKDNYEFRYWLMVNFSDLHGGNYGWKNGHPVIFDYATWKR